MSMYDWQASSWGPSQASNGMTGAEIATLIGVLSNIGGGIASGISSGKQSARQHEQWQREFNEGNRRWNVQRGDVERRSQLTEPMRDLLGQVLMARLGAPQTRFRPGPEPEFANDYDPTDINEILKRWREQHTDPTYGGIYG